MNETRNVPAYVQKSTQLDCGLASSEFRPGKHAQAKIDSRGIESIDSFLQAQSKRLVRIQITTLPNQDLREVVKDLPIMDPVRVRKCASPNLSTKSGVVKFRTEGMKASLNISKAFAIGELGESQGKKLVPTGKVPKPKVAFVTANTFLESTPGNVIKQFGKHRGPANTSPIVTWPYSIDPSPGEPLPDEYDLLVYSKNGHRPGLLEHLCELFPRHVVLHYGQYKRDQLFEAARRSRACAYLADDDHGPLALQEILLAGCPVVGVRTGAPFIQDGVTGVFVDRLPPGARCVKTEAEASNLVRWMNVVQSAMGLSRPSTRDYAAREFCPDFVLQRVLASLDTTRR